MSPVSPFRCALTGHRKLPESFDYDALYERLKDLLARGCNYFYCGMAEGFDLVCLDFLVRLKEEYNFFIEACIPYPQQSNFYSARNARLYADLLKQCDRRTTLSAVYTSGCFHKRNRYMVDEADMLFAYCTQNRGGSFFTVKYALEKDKPVEYFI